MKKRKMIMFISILFMAIGFASVSAVLYLNGQIGIVGNTGDFDVYFSKAIENGVENSSIIKDRNHLEFTTELRVVDEEYVLDYEVTNASKQYDASIVMNCTGGNDFLRVSNEFDIEEILPARTTRKGTLTLRVIKTPLEEMSVKITCEITGNAVEREEVGSEEIKNEGEFEKDTENFLKKAETYPAYNSTFLGHTLDRSKVETITLLNKKEVPENAIDSWDVSDAGNESIMAYLLDEDNNGLYELYIGQNGGINLNADASYLFCNFKNATSIKGIEKLDTSHVVNMGSMFCYCNSLVELDLNSWNTSKVTDMSLMFYMGIESSVKSALTKLSISKFDTSNVTTMDRIFAGLIQLTSLDLSGFNTSNVTDVHGMFQQCRLLESLNLSHFDTSKVTEMHYMFSTCRALTNLDISHFDTSNVTNMIGMFESCVNLSELDVRHFNTSNVTNMARMFFYCSKLTSLDLSGFNMDKVTNTMGMFFCCSELTTVNKNLSSATQMDDMFFGCSKLTANITIGLNNCTGYSNMFKNAATASGAKIIVYYISSTSSLVTRMIATKSENSNVVKVQI